MFIQIIFLNDLYAARFSKRMLHSNLFLDRSLSNRTVFFCNILARYRECYSQTRQIALPIKRVPLKKLYWDSHYCVTSNNGIMITRGNNGVVSSHVILIADPSSGSKIRRLTSTVPVRNCRITPDGKKIVLLDDYGLMTVWRVGPPDVLLYTIDRIFMDILGMLMSNGSKKMLLLSRDTLHYMVHLIWHSVSRYEHTRIGRIDVCDLIQ